VSHRLLQEWHDLRNNRFLRALACVIEPADFLQTAKANDQRSSHRAAEGTKIRQEKCLWSLDEEVNARRPENVHIVFQNLQQRSTQFKAILLRKRVLKLTEIVKDYTLKRHRVRDAPVSERTSNESPQSEAQAEPLSF